MRSNSILVLLLSALILLYSTSYAGYADYKERIQSLCATNKYYCIKIKKGQSWENLWPNFMQRDIVQRLNRTDMRLYYGQIIAVPTDLNHTTVWDISPFPKQIHNYYNKKLILVNQKQLAWGAYDTKGELRWWGPIASGKDYCSDIKRSCKTITGAFRLFHKEGPKCVSNVFPVGEGGAKMPYCMFFYRGYALHGSYEVIGYRDSHGCVRMFIRDAKWLNHHFIDLPTKENPSNTTMVIIQEV